MSSYLWRRGSSSGDKLLNTAATIIQTAWRHRGSIATAVASRHLNRLIMPPTGHHHKKHKGGHHTGHSSGIRASAGAGSTGDMNKVEYKKKHVSMAKVASTKAFKKKVETALTSDFPLIKSIYFGGASFAGNLDVQAYN